MMFRTNGAENEVANQSLLLKLGQNGQRFLNRSFWRLTPAAGAKIDDIKTIDTEISKIVMYTVNDPDVKELAHRPTRRTVFLSLLFFLQMRRGRIASLKMEVVLFQGILAWVIHCYQ